MDFSACPEDEFHDWYDLEHVPERLRIPGFLNAERWIDVKPLPLRACQICTEFVDDQPSCLSD